jgi:hypothetical protein
MSICPYGDNQWFWAGHMAHVSCMLGQICGMGMTRIICDLPNLRAKTLPDDIHRANQFHVHQHHHFYCFKILIINGLGWSYSYGLCELHVISNLLSDSLSPH